MKTFLCGVSLSGSIITSGGSQEWGEMDICLILTTVIDFKGDTILSTLDALEGVRLVVFLLVVVKF